MAWTQIAHTSASDATGQMPSAPIDTTGATLLVVVGGQAGTVPADSYHNLWTQAVQRTRAGVGVPLRVWYCIHPAVGPDHRFAVESNGAIEVLAYSGVRSSVDQVARAVGAASSTVQQAGTVTPSADNSLVLAAWAVDDSQGSTSFTVDSGFSVLEAIDTVSSQTFGVVLATLVQSAAAAVAPAMTRHSTASTNGDASVVVAFAPQPGQTPAVLAHTSLATAPGGTTSAIDTTGASVLAVVVSWSSGDIVFPTSGGKALITDSESNKWLCLGPSLSHADAFVFICVNPTTSATHTFTYQSTGGSLAAVALSGVVAFDPLNSVGTGGDGTGTSVSAGNLTPTVDGALIIAGWQIGDPNGSVTWARVQGFSNESLFGSSNASIATTLTTAVAVGDTILLGTTSNFSSGALTPTVEDDLGNVYHRIAADQGGQLQDVIHTQQLDGWWCVVTHAGTPTVTYTPAAGGSRGSNAMRGSHFTGANPYSTYRASGGQHQGAPGTAADAISSGTQFVGVFSNDLWWGMTMNTSSAAAITGAGTDGSGSAMALGGSGVLADEWIHVGTTNGGRAARFTDTVQGASADYLTLGIGIEPGIFTVNNGFVLDEMCDVRSGSSWGSVAGHLIQTTAASASATLTRTTAQSFGDQGILVSFTPASGGGGGGGGIPFLPGGLRPQFTRPRRRYV